MGSVGATGGTLGATWSGLVGSQVIAKLFKPGLSQLGGRAPAKVGQSQAESGVFRYVSAKRLDQLRKGLGGSKSCPGGPLGAPEAP